MRSQVINSVFDLESLDDAGIFEGYASVFNDIDNVRDKVEAGAFTQSLQAHRVSGRMPPLLWQHDTREPIGVFREIREDHKGLFVKGQLFIDDIARAKQAHKLMSENALSGLSIGFKTIDSEIDPMTGVRTLLKIDLMEISLVTFPALDSARVSAVKTALDSGRIPHIREFEAFLRDAGFSRKQAKSIVAGGYKTIETLRDAGSAKSFGSDVSALSRLTERLLELSY